VTIGLEDWLGGFPQIVELAQLMRHVREDRLHGRADRLLAIRDDAANGHRQRLLDFAQ
jgi:hypothetical protein